VLSSVDDAPVGGQELQFGDRPHTTSIVPTQPLSVVDEAGQLGDDVDRVSQITRHHKVLREMKAMDDQLFTMKQDFANRLRVVRQGEQRYLEKQRHTVEYLAKFKSYIVETDTKRLRAERKEQEERKAIEAIQQEMKKLREEIQRKKRKLKDQKRKLNHFRKYKQYLELVLQATTPSAKAPMSQNLENAASQTSLVVHHQYNDVEELLARYANLTANNADLQQRVAELQQQISMIQSQRQALRKERQNEILVNNSILAKMMKDLEQETALVTELTLAADLADRERLERSQLLGEVDMAIDNIYEKACRIVKRSKVADPTTTMTGIPLGARRRKAANPPKPTASNEAGGSSTSAAGSKSIVPALQLGSTGETPLLLGPGPHPLTSGTGNALVVSESDENKLVDPAATAAAAAAAAAEDRRIFSIFEQQYRPPSRFVDIQATLKTYITKLNKIEEALATLHKISEICRHSTYAATMPTSTLSGSSTMSHIQSTAKPRNVLSSFATVGAGLLVGPPQPGAQAYLQALAASMAQSSQAANSSSNNETASNMVTQGVGLSNSNSNTTTWTPNLSVSGNAADSHHTTTSLGPTLSNSLNTSSGSTGTAGYMGQPGSRPSKLGRQSPKPHARGQSESKPNPRVPKQLPKISPSRR